MNLNPLIFIYIGIQAANAIFSGLLWLFNKKQLAYLYLITFWLGNLLNFGTQIYFDGNKLMTALTLSFYLITTISLVKLYSYSHGLTMSSLRPYVKLLVGAISLSLIFHYSNLGFTLTALPIAITVAAPLLILSLKNIFMKWSSVTVIQRTFGVLIFMNGLHFLDFPFLRYVESFAPIGFAIAFIFMFIFSIFLPAFIGRQLENNNVQVLQGLVDMRTQELQLLNDEKEHLVHILCHDLSNNIQIADLNLKVIKKTNELSELNSDKLEKASFSIGIIKQVLKQVKHMSAIKEGKFNIEMTQVDPNKVTKTCEKIFKDRGLEKSIDISFTNEVKDGLTFLSNEIVLIHNIIANFLTNSIKFTPAGGKVEFKIQESTDEQGIIISISDSGIGMDDDKISSIYKHQQTTELGTNGEKGTGLGLSVALFYLDKVAHGFELKSRPVSNYPTSSGTDINIIFKA
jgi:signal transduction histidine kinase